MGFLDRLVGGGGRAKEAPKEEPQQAPVSMEPTPSFSAGSSSSPDLGHTTPTYGPPSLDLPSITASAPTIAGLSPDMGQPGAERLYNPYEGISAAAIGKKHAFKLPSQPEFVFEEEAAVKKRAWSENLQFYTGIGYLTGGIAGVSAGAFTYATVKPEIPLDTMKLKMNRILNLSGARAKPFSNGAAILGLYFSCLENLISNQLDEYHLPEATSTLTAGAVAGALFRSPRGPRQAIAAGLVGAVAGTGISALRLVFPSL